MAMANLPARTDQSSTPERTVDLLVQQMAKGRHPREIARRIYPNHADRAKRSALYRKLRRIVLADPRVAQSLADEAKIEMLVALAPATHALGERASRGRPDAIKLLYEASGFHNPKIKHEHSGEIKVKLDMPRPKFEDEIVDADVVDGPE